MNATALDQIQLNFSPAALGALNVIIAIILFGVALDLRVADFRAVLRRPHGLAVGLCCQFLLLPSLAWLCIIVLQPSASIALGLLLLAACPGGNVSNFLTAMAQGNAALSVSLSGLSTLASIVMTPVNFMFWAGHYAPAESLLRELSLTPSDIVLTVMLILVIPTLCGMGVTARFPAVAARIKQPMRRLSMIFLGLFIVAALFGNWRAFLGHVGVAFWIVAIVNALGLACGYALTKLAGLSEADRRAVSFETGIQNSGFGLIICFNHFAGLGGMAMIVAWWGVWHLISGWGLATFWRRRGLRPQSS